MFDSKYGNPLEKNRLKSSEPTLSFFHAFTDESKTRFRSQNSLKIIFHLTSFFKNFRSLSSKKIRVIPTTFHNLLPNFGSILPTI